MHDDLQNDEPDFYETLGVAPDASPEALKRAYFRLVRVHRPDDQPEAFQKYHLAYQTLSSPPRRRAHDQMRRYGGEIRKRMEEATALIEIEPRRAIRLLKEILVLSPDAVEPRLLLSKANLKCGEYQSAELELKRLAARNPQDAALHYELAYCLWMQDRASEAEHEIERTLALDPLFHDALMLMAHLHQTRRESGRAVSCLERAIALDGYENHNDLAALLRLLTVHVVEQDEANIERTAKRLHAVLPADEGRIAEGLTRIIDLACDFYKNRNFSGAHRIVQIAHHSALRDLDVIDRINCATQGIARAADAAQVAQDRRINGALQNYLCGKYLSPTDADFAQTRDDALAAETERRNKAVAGLRARVLEEAGRNAGPYRLMVAHLRATYGVMADAEAKMLDDVLKIIGSGTEATGGDAETGVDNIASVPDQATHSAARPSGYVPRVTLGSVARSWATRWRSSN